MHSSYVKSFNFIYSPVLSYQDTQHVSVVKKMHGTQSVINRSVKLPISVPYIAKTTNLATYSVLYI